MAINTDRPPGDDNLKKLYESLKPKNPGMPDFERFKTDMQNDSVLNRLYQKMKKAEPELPEFDQFKVDLFGQKKKDSYTTSLVHAGQNVPEELKEDFGKRYGIFKKICLIGMTVKCTWCRLLKNIMKMLKP